MNEFLALIHNLTSPDWIMQHGGLYIVAFIVFAETGLFVGFFLPGDSILFITGMIIANTVLPGGGSLVHLTYWVLLIAAAGIVGNFLGYWIGKQFGTHLMQRKDSWLFKKKYLFQAKEFYEKKGGGAIVLARFLPIVRTFAPIVAGMVKMNSKKFTFYNIVGSFAWVGSIVTAGYLLGENAWVQNNLDKIIIGIVVITTAPLFVQVIKGKINGKKANVAIVPLEEDEAVSKHK